MSNLILEIEHSIEFTLLRGFEVVFDEVYFTDETTLNDTTLEAYTRLAHRFTDYVIDDETIEQLPDQLHDELLEEQSFKLVLADVHRVSNARLDYDSFRLYYNNKEIHDETLLDWFEHYIGKSFNQQAKGEGLQA